MAVTAFSSPTCDLTMSGDVDLDVVVCGSPLPAEVAACELVDVSSGEDVAITRREVRDN